MESSHRAIILPAQQKILTQMGQQIRMARLRRNISVNLAAERAGVSRQSVWAVEKGSPSVAIGIYLKVLNAIGCKEELLKVCEEDPLGRTLQDMRDDKYRRKS